jgi:hypothetical protein
MPFSPPFSVLTIPIRVYSCVINFIQEVSSSAGMQTGKDPGFTISLKKTQQSGRQEIYIRHLPIAPEDKKGQQKIIINSR